MAIDFYGPEGLPELRPPGTALPRDLAAFEQMCTRIAKDGQMLDVGCADGFASREIRQRRPDVSTVGIDFSMHQLELNASGGGNRLARVDLGDGLPFTDDTFDGVYACELIEHLMNPDLFLDEVRRVLRKGGVLVMTTPNLAAWYNRALLAIGTQPMYMESSAVSTRVGAGVTKKFRQYDTPVGHIRVMTQAALCDLLTMHGFDVVHLGAVTFERFPQPVQKFDSWLAKVRPSLASIHVVAAQPR